jgi:DNA-binding GntR family transcriptional regulator
VAAALGDRVSSDLMARITSLSPADLAGALDELEWNRWLIFEPRGYSFLARVTRQVIARDMLTPGQRQRVLEAAGITG